MTDDARPNSNDPDALLARYGDHLVDSDLTEAQQKELLAVLWQIMVAFVDLGFSLKPGEKITPKSDVSFDDVLHYLHLDEPAPETPASPKKNKDEEPR